MNEKFIKKYMRIAKLVGEDQNPCYSRHIGVIIVNPKENKIISTGYNGPPKGTPHCDDYAYLKNVVYPMMSQEDKDKINTQHNNEIEGPSDFAYKFAKCGQCPRKLLGYKSGENSDMCSCQHAERNAITNANGATNGCYMFCWCGIPCWECAGAVINAGISQLVITRWQKDYSKNARWLIKSAGIEIFEKEEGYYLEEYKPLGFYGSGYGQSVKIGD